MPVRAKFDSFNVDTGAPGTTQDRTGYGFQFSGCLAAWNGRTEAGNANGPANHQFGIGLGASPSSRALIATQSEDDAPTAVSDQGFRADALVGNLTTTPAWDGLLDINSKNTDGWQSIIDDTFVTDLRLKMLAWEMDSEIISFQEPAAT